MGLAECNRRSEWRLDHRLEETLRTLGLKNDIIRSMQSALGERGDWRRFRAFDPGSADQAQIVGRISGKIFDEYHERLRAFVVDGIDGHQWHVELGRGHADLHLEKGSVISASPMPQEARQIDRTIVDFAEKNHGFYEPAKHVEIEPKLNRAYQQRIIRRLEAMRRANIVIRDREGAFVIPKDFEVRASVYDQRRSGGFQIDVKSYMPIERLIERKAYSWLDQELQQDLTASKSAGQGFGRELDDALNRRRDWLRNQGFLERDGTRESFRENAIAELHRAELHDAGSKIGKDLGREFSPIYDGQRRVEGRLAGYADLASGRYAVIEQYSREFTLVPWRDVLERQRGRYIEGHIRGRGIDWSFGRSRGRGLGR